jgi:ubiquinone/menaquinone biosynthesis C-methylase UbiE
MAVNYNKAAWFYDRLSRMVYGRALINAQVYPLQFIPANSNILIVGGGTGWILEELTKIHPSGLQITYVEVAKNMMALSKKRNVGKNEVVFIIDSIENVNLPSNFDVVITSFLFDNFKEPTLGKIFNHIYAQLKPLGLWLNTDFQLTGRLWQQLFLKSMLLFFKVFGNVESSTLPDMNNYFESNGYKVLSEKTFFGDFIVAKVYKKQTYEV